MTTVYIVTQGEYSDYGIQGIFSKRELAERFKQELDKKGGDSTDIEEWVLDERANDRFCLTYICRIHGRVVVQSVIEDVRSDTYAYSSSHVGTACYYGMSSRSPEHAHELAMAEYRKHTPTTQEPTASPAPGAMPR